MAKVIQFPRREGAPLPAVKTTSDPSGIEEAFSSAQAASAADLIRLAELNHEMKNLLKKILKQAKLR